MANALGAGAFLVGRSGPGDGLLISADRNPNVRGALVTGLVTSLPPERLTQLGAWIDEGKVRCVVSVGEDLLAAGLTEAQLARVAVVYLGTHANATSAIARIVVPTFTVLERTGSFVNQQFRLQKFFQAVPGPAGAIDDLTALTRLLSSVEGEYFPPEPAAIWPEMARAIDVLQGITFAGIPATGRLLDGSRWAGLPFPEGPALHFQPAAKP
jgi:NADH-quinone oxidoreductase subunit G